jgi:hypothetical protein
MSAGMIDEQAVCRVLAWLLRNEKVRPESIERAVASAVDMRPGEAVSLTGDGPEPASMRRAFVTEQVRLLEHR